METRRLAVESRKRGSLVKLEERLKLTLFRPYTLCLICLLPLLPKLCDPELVGVEYC
jgi:hypothetical protein